MAVAAILLTGCSKKEGEYNPSRKLTKVYEENFISYNVMGIITNDTTERYLSEQWTWNGDKLNNIKTYKVNGEIEDNIDFTYDGKRITRATRAEENYYEDYIYNGKKLTEINSYKDGEICYKWAVTHDGKKIVRLERTSYTTDTVNSKGIMGLALIPIVMPGLSLDMMTQLKKLDKPACGTKGGESAVDLIISFTWSGDNVSVVNFNFFENGNACYEYSSYDNCNAPNNGLTPILTSMNASSCCSKNNPTQFKTTITSPNINKEDDGTYEYQYEDKWPIKRNHTYTFSSTTNSGTAITNIYYEYVN